MKSRDILVQLAYDFVWLEFITILHEPPSLEVG